MRLIARLTRTLVWFVIRPVHLAERFAQPDFGRSFCPPLTFLVLGILFGFALMQGAWTVSVESVTRMAQSETDWVAWMARTLIDDLSKLSLSSIVVRTLPAAIATVAAAAVLGRCVAGRRGSSLLAAAACMVIGFKLFLRFGQGLAQLSMVWFSNQGKSILPAGWNFETVLRGIFYAYIATIGYVFFFAGIRFLAAVMRNSNRTWLRSWPVSMGLACGLSSLMFLGTFIAPLTVWNLAQAQRITEDLYLLKVLPLGPARLDFTDDQDVFLTSTVLLRNQSDSQILVALPRQISMSEDSPPIECQYEAEPMLDGTCLLEKGAARVVRATWRLGPSHRAAVLQEATVPLMIQLGSVDDVFREQVESSTLAVAVDPAALAEMRLSQLGQFVRPASHTEVR